MNDNKDKNYQSPKYSLIRRFFLNLLIITFIIIIYFYVSDYFGSISTIFLKNSKFFVSISFTLLIFAFFSILAGPLPAIIAGFFGELIYQFSFYENIRLEWCVIVSLIGLTVSIYKYKPLKYKSWRKIFFTFISLTISAFIISFLITIFQAILNPIINLNSLLVDYGCKYLVHALLSVVIIVPLLVLIYDRALANKEQHFYNLFFTHHPIYQSDHTFYLRFGRTYIYFCSRCSGVIIGGLIIILVNDVLNRSIGFTIEPEIAVILCIFLPIPGLIDWGTQRLLLRKSTTESRLFTGFIIGIALYYLSFTDKYIIYMFFLIIFYFSVVGIALYIGQKRELKKAEEEEHKSPRLEEDQFE